MSSLEGMVTPPEEGSKSSRADCSIFAMTPTPRIETITSIVADSFRQRGAAQKERAYRGRQMQMLSIERPYMLANLSAAGRELAQKVW